MAYVVTTSKPTSVRLACAGKLIDDTQHLVSASSNIISIYQPHTLTPLYELTCFGRIASLTVFRPGAETRDHLFVTTEDNQYFTLSVAGGKIVTGSTGDLAAVGMLPREDGHRVIVNKNHILVNMYLGVLTVFPIHHAINPRKRSADGSRLFGTPVTCRFNELKAQELVMLPSVDDRTTFGIIHQDMYLRSHFKSYQLHVKKNDIDLIPGRLASKLEVLSRKMLVLNVGHDKVVCVDEKWIFAIAHEKPLVKVELTEPTLFSSATQLSETQWLLGDDYGLLYTLDLQADEPQIKRLETSVTDGSQATQFSAPTVLVSLRDEVFLGSHFGDSQLISWPKAEVIAKRTNLGPISDFLVEQNTGAAGASSIVTASGAYKNGCLKIIKYGVGMSERSEVPIEDVRGIWGLDKSGSIVVAFVSGYIVLRVSIDGEMEQVGAGDEDIIFAGEFEGKILLVSKDAIKLTSDDSVDASVDLKGTTAAQLQGDQLFVLAQNMLYSYQVSASTIKQGASQSFDKNETSALAVSGPHVFVSFWNDTPLWIGNEQLEKISDVDVGAGLVVRSILVQTFNGIETSVLLLGLNDGSVLSFQFDKTTATATTKRQVMLGSTPVSLQSFDTAQGPNVFAVCDRPTVIYSTRGKLGYSAVNLPPCNYFSSFVNAALESSIIVATDDALRFGGIDDVQKLQFRTIKLGELARRVVALENLYATINLRLEVEAKTGNETQVASIHVYSKASFEECDAYELEEEEVCQALCLHETPEGEQRILVGTSFQEEDEMTEEHRRGRLLVFKVDRTSRKLSLEAEEEVPGNVYCVESVPGGGLVVGINSGMRLYSYDEAKLTKTDYFRCSTIPITLATKGSRVIYGDLMKSCYVLKVEGVPETNEVNDGGKEVVTNTKLVEIARDFTPAWVSSVGFFGDDCYLAAESEGGLILLQKSDSPLADAERSLERIGLFNYGEMVNRILPGQLIAPEEGSLVTPQCIIGTVDGSIAIVGKIQQHSVDFLLALQSAIGEAISAIGNLSHARFRAFKLSNRKSLELKRFVDGDLIEHFLDMTEAEQSKVADKLQKSRDEVEKIVENLSRLH